MTSFILEALHDLQCSHPETLHSINNVLNASIRFVTRRMHRLDNERSRMRARTAVDVAQALVALAKHRTNDDLLHLYNRTILNIRQTVTSKQQSKVESQDVEAVANVLTASVLLGQHSNANDLFVWLMKQRNEDGEFKRPKVR